ncbi:hypothetical protein D3C84_1139170 [compost metagenome]
MSKGNAKQHLHFFGDAQNFPDGAGKETEGGLGNTSEASGSERQEKGLSVHADISGDTYVVTERRHEQQSDMRRVEERVVVRRCSMSPFLILA